MYRGIVHGKSVYEPWFWFDLVQSTVSACARVQPFNDFVY